MRFRLRAVLALTAVVALNLALLPTRGVMYSHVAFALTMLSLLVGLVACRAADRSMVWRGGLVGGDETDGNTFLLACVTLALGALNINSTDLSYADVEWARQGLVVFALAGYLATLAGLFL